MEFPEGGRGIVCGPFSENPAGWGGHIKNPFRGGVWIFSGTTHCMFLMSNLWRPWDEGGDKRKSSDLGTCKASCLVEFTAYFLKWQSLKPCAPSIIFLHFLLIFFKA